VQVIEGANSTGQTVYGGTCPDCCGDLIVSPIHGGWVLACAACGVTVRGQRRVPATRSARLAADVTAAA
jgi:hypothetical protein